MNGENACSEIEGLLNTRGRVPTRQVRLRGSGFLHSLHSWRLTRSLQPLAGFPHFLDIDAATLKT